MICMLCPDVEEEDSLSDTEQARLIAAYQRVKDALPDLEYLLACLPRLQKDARRGRRRRLRDRLSLPQEGRP